MRKLSFVLLAVAALGMIACSGNDVKYSVKGYNGPEDGTNVYLVDQITSAHIDSAVVSGGKFAMKGKAGKDAYLAVDVDGMDWYFLFFNDGKPVEINVKDSTVNGSALNTGLSVIDMLNTRKYDEYYSLIEAFVALPPEEQEAQMDEFIPKYRAALKDYTDFFLGMIDDNKDNLIPVAFIDRIPSLAGQDKFNELLASDAPFAKHPYVLDLKRRMDESAARQKEAQERKQAIIGQHFLDLEEADPDGNMHKLSEYVGRGKWVLVDFWAAWCGPCKAEMPNVVEAYKKYHSKGFDIVGLSFDREKSDWVKAIKEWDMPWIHLSDLKYWQSLASDVYNVNSIPDNLLIDPEGTVVARGLRGAALSSRLAEIFK